MFALPGGRLDRRNISIISVSTTVDKGVNRMTSNLNLILTVPPSQAHAALAFGVPVAHMAYRMGAGPRLFRGSIPLALRGGLLMLDDRGFSAQQGENAPFCQQVIRECTGRGYDGVVADWENRPSSAQAALAQELDKVLADKGWPLYITEPYGSCTRHARVMISSAVSGGSLAARLSEAGEKYGIERVALAVERSAEDFTMPAPDGCGRSLSQEELRRLMEEYHSPTYFSGELCAHYFTYRPAGEGGVHFVLFDDEGSIRKKLQVARNAGVRYGLMAYPQVADLLPGVLR